MKKLLVLLLLFVFSLPSLADTPSAMITNLAGRAVVITKEKREPAQPMDSLLPGTLVELRGGAKMTVAFLAPNTLEQYEGPCLIGIGKNRGKVFDGDASSRKVIATDSAPVKAVDPHALSEHPGDGMLSVSKDGSSLNFSWVTTLPGPYTVSVLKPEQGAEPRTHLWSEQTDSKNSTYKGPVLNSHFTYVVKVESGPTTIARSQMRMADGTALLSQAKSEADKLKLADPTDTTPHVLMSTAYAQHGQHKESTDSLNMAIEAQPSEDAFIGRMKTMMGKISKTADKDTEYASGYYQAQENWGTNTYYDPEAWGWEDGWDH
jgi:hypothetical protein